jgi:hypothetical protein
MDTVAFVAAHEAFEAHVVEAEESECAGWSARLVAAHAIGTDRLLTETAARILFGTKLMYRQARDVRRGVPRQRRVPPGHRRQHR